MLREKEYSGFVSRQIGQSWDRRCVVTVHQDGVVRCWRQFGDREQRANDTLDAPQGDVELVDAADLPLFAR